ncbi:MAG: hypothetical protein U1E65_00360 [Myxococcota bacterium]
MAAALVVGACSSASAPPGETVPVTPDDLAAAKGCPAPSGAGTMHTDTVTTDETWTAAGSPHHVPNSLTLEAKVTIEPCAVVLLGGQTSITVGNRPKTGGLVAKGAVDQASDGTASARPVTFDAEVASEPWAQIYVSETGTAEFSVVAIKNGGSTVVGEAGALRVGGNAGGTNDGAIVRSTAVDRVLIQGSTSYGLNLDAWGTLTEGSSKLWIRGSGSDTYPYPVRIEPGIAGTLPKDLVTTGNHREGILMNTSKTFSRDDTLQNLGIPYVQRGALYVNPSEDGPTVTLRIEAGVTMAFEENAGSGVYFGSTSTRLGMIVAEGTAAAPIVFTSAKATKAAGDWMALYFRYFPTSGNRISHAVVEYAGGFSGTSGYGCGPANQNNDSAVIISGQGANQAQGPDTAFIQDSSFDHIGGATVIVSGWYGDGPNFSNSNTFGGETGGCHVSQPRTNFNGGDYCQDRLGICW